MSDRQHPRLTFSATYKLYEKECNITPRQGPSAVSAATLVPFILATFFFITRIIAKSSGLAGGWGWDDYTIIAAFVSHPITITFPADDTDGLEDTRCCHLCS